MSTRLFKIVVPIASTLLTLAALEIGARALDGQWEITNELDAETGLFKSAYPVTHDPMLGWIPRAGASGRDNIWHTEVTILPDAVRSNGQPPPDAAAGGGPVVAVGDSFTFGDEVSDDETWPAALEWLTGRRVINGGVFGYGVDQSVLRALILMEHYRPRALIVSFIPDDIGRTELSERGSASKPYFELRDDALVLRNTPVPLPRPAAHAALRRVKNVAGHSHLAHELMRRLAPEFWYLDGGRDVRVHRDGVRVSCALLNDLARHAAEDDVALYVLAQYQYDSPDKPDDLKAAQGVLDCLDRSRIRVIDLRSALLEIKMHDPARYEAFFDQHMTVAGNRFVAARVAEAMARRRIATTSQ